MTETTSASGPVIERPAMPVGYGLPDSSDGLLTWAEVEVELVAAHNYWLASVRPDGRPHVVPRWGVWLDGRFYYDGSPETRHVRNVSSNPAMTLNLESGTRTVILEGDSFATRADADGLGGRLSAAFGKYAEAGYSPEPGSWAGESGGGLRVFAPTRALAWFDFPKDCTRFRFGSAGRNPSES
ncbi:hypothetical protein ABIB25_000235 [Nakamurella sp. UYEF19]|uniref:pyridoxamine 5'-phosphate oxidase family protein n=1 Tax=Nakamurella sp. UYEF19 TaxID=1756392 RepID=UPI00339A6C46